MNSLAMVRLDIIFGVLCLGTLQVQLGSTATVTDPKQNHIQPDTPITVDIEAPISLEPLPEYYASTSEKKLISKYWEELETRRMAMLRECESKLWSKTQQTAAGSPGAILYLPSEASKVAKRAKPTSPTLVAKVLIPEYEGRAVVDEIEESLAKCLRETRRLRGPSKGENHKADGYITEIGRQLDQIGACQAAGGVPPSFEKTDVAIGRVKGQIAKAAGEAEVLALLENYLLQLKLDQETCIATLGLPNQLNRELDYPQSPATKKS
ncbi:unnamed protein product [Lymnaea stagnalis]|uniref:Uncharacterized protein n=1 Tax=Lymnaea stagnalis TaxID=6523 RepID=A0AAV2IG25_LYMST